MKVGLKLAQILDREIIGRLSVATFVDHYLRISDFPVDVLESLSKGEVNLFEAEQLARVTATRLDVSQAEAKRKRAEFLSARLRSRSSGEGLRRRINELLLPSKLEGVLLVPSSDAIEPSADLEDFAPYDSTHLLWEQIKQLGFAFRDLTRADVTDEDLEQLIDACDPVMNILLCIQRWKQPPARTSLFF